MFFIQIMNAKIFYLASFVGQFKVFSEKQNSLQAIKKTDPVHWFIVGWHPPKTILKKHYCH